MSQIVVGTAGHIDHGKTSLVQSLTGTNTDHLIEEKKRGLTIDLGFAYLGDRITIVDVPGHEKFIRNMVAGASSIHFALIVIAADDGVMPQTLEHLDILTSLGVNKGMVALTKIDVVKDLEWIDLVEIDIRDLLKKKNFELISFHRVDNISGSGIQDLKAQILSLKREESVSTLSSKFRINIDRVFTKVGFGTIATGTVRNGSILVGHEVEILPLREKSKIRAMQSRGGSVQKVSSGDRAAINLKNIKTSDLNRGSVITSPNLLTPYFNIIVHLTININSNWIIKNKQRLRFYFGTSEIFGRVTLCNYSHLKQGEGDNAIIQLETIASVALDDKFIVRSYSPMETIAGGIIIEGVPNTRWRKLKEKSKSIPLNTKKRFKYFVNRERRSPKTLDLWKKIFINSEHLIDDWISHFEFKIIKRNNLLYSSESEIESFDEINSFFDKSYIKNPFRKTLNDENILTSLNWSIEWLDHIKTVMLSKKLIENRNGGILKVGYKFKLSNKDLEDINEIEIKILNSGMKILDFSELTKILNINKSRINDLIHLLVSQSKIIEIGTTFYIHCNIFNLFVNELKMFFNENNTLSVSQIKEMTGLSRKVAIPLLEYLDQNNFTDRVNDNRIIGIKLHG